MIRRTKKRAVKKSKLQIKQEKVEKFLKQIQSQVNKKVTSKPKKKVAAAKPKKRVAAKPKKRVAAAKPKKRVVATKPKKRVAAAKPKKRVVATKPKKRVAAKPKKKVVTVKPKKRVVAAKPKKKVVATKPKKRVAAKPKKKRVVKRTKKTKKEILQEKINKFLAELKRIKEEEEDVYVEEPQPRIVLVKPPSELVENAKRHHMPFPDDFVYPEIDESEITVEDVFERLEAQISNVTNKTKARVADIFYKGKENRTEEQHFLFTAMMHGFLLVAIQELADHTIPPDPTMTLTRQFFSPEAM
jgi:hypothetical protein